MPAAKVGQATLFFAPEDCDPDFGVPETRRVELRDSTSGTTREMRLALACGVHPADNRNWLVVGREGRLLSLGRIRLVRLHPATEAGTDAALRDARDSFGFDRDHGWTVFVARVLVEGEGAWDNPTDVIPAWVVEGRERPVDVAGQSESR